MQNSEGNWIVITDSHVSETHNNVTAFFLMLERLSELALPVIFLGDIFELWVGIKGLEDETHRRFMDWCLGFKKLARLGFIEGNHEYFVLDRHADCFDFSDRAEFMLVEFKTLLIHGDLLNPADKGYLLMRKVLKNALIRQVFRWLPGAGTIVAKLKKALTKPKDGYGFLPEAALKSYASRQLGMQVELILCGHFHKAFTHATEHGRLQVLPAWLEGQQVSLWNPRTLEIRALHWKDL